MTRLLTDVLHERADHLDAPHVDLDRITRDGDRRVRRRRTAVAGGLAAAAVAVGAAVPALLPADDPGGTTGTAADGTTTAPVPLSWTTGSTLHRAGSPDVDLGVDVRAWVWVGDAVAFTDTERRVRLWTGDALDVIGRTSTAAPDDAELVSDGTFIAWVSSEGRLVRYDVATGESVTAPAMTGRQLRVTAIDGSQVYAADSAGVYAWQPSGPEGYRTLSEDPQDVVLDAEGGTTVQLSGDRQARVSGPGRDTTLTIDGFANLSPTGAQVMAESDDEGVLLDTATGELLPLRSGHAWSLPFQWLDDTRVVVMAFDGIDQAAGEPRAFLQDCDTVTGECDGAGTEVPATYGDFQLPLGVHFSR